MASTKEFHFTPQDLLQLLTHYTDGDVPMNGEVKEFLVHPHFSRKIALLIESAEWENPLPLFLQYDGKRVASWTKGEETPTYTQKAEAPRRQ